MPADVEAGAVAYFTKCMGTIRSGAWRESLRRRVARLVCEGMTPRQAQARVGLELYHASKGAPDD